MAFSEIELKRIEAVVGPLCGRRSPAHARHQVRTEYRVEGQDVLIVEVRVVWDDPSRWMDHGVAKLKFNRKAGEWGEQRVGRCSLCSAAREVTCRTLA